MENKIDNRLYQRDNQELRSNNLLKRMPNNNLLVEISDTSDYNHSEEITNRLIEPQLKTLPTYKYQSPQTMGSHRHKPPAADPRFRKVHKPNSLSTQSEVIFDGFIKPVDPDNLKSSPQLISNETPPSLQRHEFFLPPENSIPTSFGQHINVMRANENSKLNNNSCQTESSIFKISHNICQTDPISHLESTVHYDLSANDTLPTVQKDQYLLKTQTDKCLNLEIEPVFNEWIIEEPRKLESILEPKSRKTSERSTHSSSPSYYSTKSALKDENLHKVDEIPENLMYKTSNIPVNKTRDKKNYQFLNFKPKRILSSSLVYLNDDLQNRTTIASLINILLLIIAFTFASLVLLAFFYLMQPIVYSFIDYVCSLLYVKEVEEETTLINESVTWLYDFIKTTFEPVVRVLSKKRKCSVSLFTSESGCS